MMDQIGRASKRRKTLCKVLFTKRVCCGEISRPIRLARKTEFLQLKPQNANYFSQITPVFSLSITVENGFVFNLPRTAGPIFRTLDVIASGENSIFQDLFDSLGDDVFAQRFDIYIAYSEGNIPVTANCWQGYLIESIQF